MIGQKKILILSDSLALPRSEPELVTYEQTWPYLLGKDYFIHQVSIGGGTVSDILRQVHYHKLFKPDIVIIQCGIVDCAPRFMTKFELDLMKRLPLVGNKLISTLNSKSVRKFRNITYTSLPTFEQSLLRIKSMFRDVYSLSIIPAQDGYEKELPGISHNILKYNEVLKNVLIEGFIPLEEFPADGLMSDFHHLTAKGHKYIYDTLIRIL